MNTRPLKVSVAVLLAAAAASTWAVEGAAANPRLPRIPLAQAGAGLNDSGVKYAIRCHDAGRMPRGEESAGAPLDVCLLKGPGGDRIRCDVFFLPSPPTGGAPIQACRATTALARVPLRQAARFMGQGEMDGAPHYEVKCHDGPDSAGDRTPADVCDLTASGDQRQRCTVWPGVPPLGSSASCGCVTWPFQVSW